KPTPQNIGVLLALCTGMRIGEVCALKWEDVDFNQKIISVKYTVGRVYNCESKSTEKINSSPKTSSSYREIPISKQLLRSLNIVGKSSLSPFVVGNLTNSKEPRSYRDYFARLLKRLDIPPIVFHGLRHPTR
ncbi:MAG: site-specific integrase, partial [Bacteroidales bacterium]